MLYTPAGVACRLCGRSTAASRSCPSTRPRLARSSRQRPSPPSTRTWRRDLATADVITYMTGWPECATTGLCLPSPRRWFRHNGRWAGNPRGSDRHPHCASKPKGLLRRAHAVQRSRCTGRYKVPAPEVRHIGSTDIVPCFRPCLPAPQREEVARHLSTTSWCWGVPPSSLLGHTHPSATLCCARGALASSPQAGRGGWPSLSAFMGFRSGPCARHLYVPNPRQR